MIFLIKLALPVVIYLTFVFGDSTNILKLQKSNCVVYDPVHVINATCGTTIVNRTHTVAGVYVFLTRPLDNIILYFKLFKRTDLRYRPFLMDIREDYCAFFKNNLGSIYLRRMYQMYRSYSNLNHSCPYEGDVIIKDFPMDPNLLPSIWPDGEYRLEVNIYNGETKKFRMDFYFSLKEKRKQ